MLTRLNAAKSQCKILKTREIYLYHHDKDRGGYFRVYRESYRIRLVDEILEARGFCLPFIYARW